MLLAIQFAPWPVLWITSRCEMTIDRRDYPQPGHYILLCPVLFGVYTHRDFALPDLCPTILPTFFV